MEVTIFFLQIVASYRQIYIPAAPEKNAAKRVKIPFAMLLNDYLEETFLYNDQTKQKVTG